MPTVRKPKKLAAFKNPPPPPKPETTVLGRDLHMVFWTCPCCGSANKTPFRAEMRVDCPACGAAVRVLLRDAE